jgi:hypothetical protein
MVAKNDFKIPTHHLTLGEPVPTFVPWLKIPKSIKIISKWGSLSSSNLTKKFWALNLFTKVKVPPCMLVSPSTCTNSLTHPPTHPFAKKKKNHFQGNSGFSGFLEGFNEWIGENIFRGHNFFFHVEGCLMQILSGLVRVRPRPASLVPPPPRPCGIDRSGMVKNVRPIPVEAHYYEHMQPERVGRGGGLPLV